MSLLPLATDTWTDAEYAALDRVIKSRRFTMGPEVAEFERDFAKRFGSRHAVMVNSGSSANLLMIAGLCYHPERLLVPGCEVIVPAVSWSTTFFPVHQLGMSLRFVDVGIDSLNMSVQDVEKAITPATRAVLAVNLLGNPCDLVKMRELCASQNLVLIEDNCEAMGATLAGKEAGTFGTCGSFSTFFSHHISTMEGGVVVTDDEALSHVMISLRAHGWLREQPTHSHLNINADDFVKLFRFVLPGYNLRPLEMSGALGREQLKKVSSLVAARRANAAVFQELFRDLPDVRIQAELGESSWFGFSMILRGRLEGRRSEVVDALTAAGVESRPIVSGNFLNNPVIQHLNYSVSGTLSTAEIIDQDGLFIGNHHYPIENALRRVKEVILHIK